MTSLRFGSSVCAVGAAMVGLLALSACAGDDSSGDTLGMMNTTIPATGPGDSTGSGDAPTHAADIQPIWDQHCVDGCHEPMGTGSFWLDLRPGSAYAAIVNVPAVTVPGIDFVEPGDLDMSFLWHKINGTQASVGGGGVDMPSPRVGMDATVMTSDQIDTIEAWILGGAPE